MNWEFTRDLIERHEGRKAIPYQDSLGIWTVGVGHNMSVPLSNDVINLIFQEDMQRAFNDCRRLFPTFHSMSDKRQAVLVDMMFNMGFTRLSKFSQMRDAINQEHWNRAADEMENSKWYRQVKTRGPELVNLMRNG